MDWTDQQYYDIINNSSTLRTSSKQEHLRNLKKAQKAVYETSINEIVQHPNDFEQKLKEHADNKQLSTASKANIIGAIVSLFRNSSVLRESRSNLFNMWSNMYDVIKKPIHDQYQRGEMSSKQKEAHVDFDQICQKRDELEKGSQQRLLLSLFTMIPPKRAQEFHNMVVFQRQPTKDHSNKNYVIVNNKYAKLVLNEYKTSKIYGQMVEHLPNKLKDEILTSLSQQPRKHMFVKSNGKPFSDRKSFDYWANMVLKRLFDNQYTTLGTLRHSFLMQNRPETDAEREQIASKMGHSVSTQRVYSFQ